MVPAFLEVNKANVKVYSIIEQQISLRSASATLSYKASEYEIGR